MTRVTPSGYKPKLNQRRLILMTNENQDYLQAWGNVDKEESNNGGADKADRPDFLKVEIGSTKIRVLDMVPFNYKEWWSTKGNGGEGCSIPYFDKGDLLEAENQAFMKKIFAEADAKGLKDKARKDFLRDEGYRKNPWGKHKQKSIIHVLDRASGEVKLLDKGNGIFKKLKKLALDAEYGDLRLYDVTIEMTGDKGDFTTIEYDVTPARSNTPLTDAEKALYEEKKIDLEEFKGAGDITPTIALMIAKGATFKDVLGSGSDSPEVADDKSDPSMLPEEEQERGTLGEAPEDAEKAEQARKDEEVVTEKEEVLSDEELNNINFG